MDASLSASSDRGIALVVAVLVLAVLSGLGLSLLLTLALEPRAAANQQAAASARFCAEAALEIAARELDRLSDWSLVLAGSLQSTFTDGPPSGARTLPGGDVVDITQLTSRFTCGRPSPCTDALRTVSVVERPWGANNPVWQPFLYGPPDRLGLAPADAAYVIVWVGDDGVEDDGDPLRDGGGALGQGRWMVRLRSVAIGARGARAAVEALLVRRCEDSPGVPRCEVGSRVQNWRALIAAAP